MLFEFPAGLIIDGGRCVTLPVQMARRTNRDYVCLRVSGKDLWSEGFSTLMRRTAMFSFDIMNCDS